MLRRELRMKLQWRRLKLQESLKCNSRAPRMKKWRVVEVCPGCIFVWWVTSVLTYFVAERFTRGSNSGILATKRSYGLSGPYV